MAPREADARVADDAAAGLRAAHAARGESLAVLQRRHLVVDRLLRNAAGGEQELQVGRRTVGGTVRAAAITAWPSNCPP